MLADRQTEVHTTVLRRTRASSSGDLVVPRGTRRRIGDRAFSVTAPRALEHAADTADAAAVDHHFSSSKSEALLLVYAFCVVFCSAPAVWNSLPKTVLGSDSVALKQHLVSYRKCREPLRMRHRVARSKARHVISLLSPCCSTVITLCGCLCYF